MEQSNISLDLLAIGNITLDHICKVDRIPGNEQTALIVHAKTYFGGRGANVAFTSACLGLNVALASVTGRDFIKSGYRDFLARNRVNIDKVKVTPQRRCASIKLFYTKKGDMTYFFHPLLCNSWPELGLSEDDLRTCDILYLTPFDGEKWIRKIFAMAKEVNTVVVALGEEVYRKSTKFLESAIGVADYLFLNRGELEVLLKRSDLSNIRDFFSKYKRLNCVAVTMGHLGSHLYTRSAFYKIPSVIPRRLVNSLGAGDAYVAGFLYGLFKRKSLETCGKIASVVASFVMEEEGAQSRNISIDQMQKRYYGFSEIGCSDPCTPLPRRSPSADSVKV